MNPPPTRELDLHGFRPQDVGEIVDEFLQCASAEAVAEVRIVHGRGRMILARSVHSILGRHPLVESFALATHAWGGTGATWVRVRPGKKALGALAGSSITGA